MRDSISLLAKKRPLVLVGVGLLYLFVLVGLGVPVIVHQFTYIWKFWFGE
jgi:hypothetical protein